MRPAARTIMQRALAGLLLFLSVRLNNVQVLALSDFAGGVTRVDKVATLLLSDTLALQLAGATGTRITVTVFTVVMPKPVALSPNPLALAAGTSGTLTATLSPTPTAAGTLNVTSSNPQAATVPASVSFSSGQGSVAILVSAQGAGSATITASANGGQASATVTVKAEAKVYYIHPDHLNTPRFIADETQKIVWRWDQREPFGVTPPNDDPDGDGVKFDFPLRFPGQYFDRETNLAYNYFRDYDPAIGRYIESDPLGLPVGLTTYAYVVDNPLDNSDFFGLCPPSIDVKSGSIRFYGPLVKQTGKCICPTDTVICTYDLVTEICRRGQCVPGAPRLLDVPLDCRTGQLFSPRLGRP